jgi:hypothetical protein
VTLPEGVKELAIEDSLVDGVGGAALTAPGASASIKASTIFGTVEAQTLESSNCIFTAPVLAERRQMGCVRFSFVPEGSHTPRRHRCQPDLALVGLVDPAGQERIRKRLTPQFTSTAFGDPGYAQLSPACAEEIRTGAEDGSEMGAYFHLKGPLREANLQVTLDEYLRFGLEAGAFFVT